MKQLKHYHAVNCVCDKTGMTGDFIIDIEYFKQHGKLSSLNNSVFDNLIDMFKYANENGIKTGRIYSKVFPTYFENLQEVKDLLEQGVKICWKNEGYIVSNSNNELLVTYKYNQYCTKLQESEIIDCFVGE